MVHTKSKHGVLSQAALAFANNECCRRVQSLVQSAAFSSPLTMSIQRALLAWESQCKVTIDSRA